jgi:hypothetical protein
MAGSGDSQAALPLTGEAAAGAPVSPTSKRDTREDLAREPLQPATRRRSPGAPPRFKALSRNRPFRQPPGSVVWSHEVRPRTASFRRRSVEQCASPGMIVGDDTRTRVRAGPSEPRHPLAAPTLARPRRDPGARTAKRRNREGESSGQMPGTPWPVNAGRHPTPPTAPYGRVPAMIIRMRLRAGAAVPGRLRRIRGANRSPATGALRRSTSRPQRCGRLPPSAPTVKSPAQSPIPVKSHLRSSTEPQQCDDLYDRASGGRLCEAFAFNL